MVRLTCLLRRKPGTTPEQFREHWFERHAPLVAASESGRHVLRYEQHPRPLGDYGRGTGSAYDGVTVQWFASMDAYRASIEAADFAEISADLGRFLDLDHLDFILTEAPVVVLDRLDGPRGD